jgi:DNA invertase Pin-like site-specific DNA recombinase
VGVAFVSLGEGIDCTTPAGKLQLHILAPLAEFERERIRRARASGVTADDSAGKAARTTEGSPRIGRSSWG